MSLPPPRVPLVDLRASLEPVRADLMREIEAILDGMELYLGPRQRAFEQEFARYCEVEHGVAVSSGTDALVAALLACGVEPGDEVIVPTHTFFATVEAVLHAGAVPVLVDVEPDTLTLDPEAVRRALTPATRALVPVHLYGHPADMDPLLAIARERELRVVEDAAQAHGARYGGRRCGSLGDAACFSFYFAKNLGALGEGGFVATNDAVVAERVRLLRDHGRASRFEHAVLGANRRMDEIQAAVLRLKLPRLDAGNARRREIAERYGKLLDGLPVALPVRREGCEPVHQVHPVRVAERDGLREHLTRAGIGTGVHYPVPAHRQPALQGRPHRAAPAPRAERACRELLSLPVYPELRDEQVELVADEVRRFFGR
ncbi:MAG: DegT/DnrJ/EryC1/StrS family aminotransferase [Myxococcota bacterium]|nr:DegT/DnrJ/EryC1/StrS family aminotransferase [Myxococcota bacterium]